MSIQHMPTTLSHSVLTFAQVRRGDDDEVGDEGGESGRETGLRDEAEFQLVQTDRLVVASPIPA